jgi:hypothetical protein
MSINDGINGSTCGEIDELKRARRWMGRLVKGQDDRLISQPPSFFDYYSSLLFVRNFHDCNFFFQVLVLAMNDFVLHSIPQATFTVNGQILQIIQVREKKNSIGQLNAILMRL